MLIKNNNNVDDWCNMVSFLLSFFSFVANNFDYFVWLFVTD